MNCCKSVATQSLYSTSFDTLRPLPRLIAPHTFCLIEHNCQPCLRPSVFTMTIWSGLLSFLAARICNSSKVAAEITTRSTPHCSICAAKQVQHWLWLAYLSLQAAQGKQVTAMQACLWCSASHNCAAGYSIAGRSQPCKQFTAMQAVAIQACLQSSAGVLQAILQCMK